MKLLTLIIVMIFCSLPVLASKEQVPEEGQLVESKKHLDETLKNLREVPYMENGKIKGYVTPDQDRQNLSDLGLKQGDVITAPNQDSSMEN